MRKKSELRVHVEFLIMKLHGLRKFPKFIRCDNAGENTKQLELMSLKWGVKMEYTAPNTPQQNGKCERKFPTIRDKGLAAMLDAKLTQEYQDRLWAEAMNWATDMENMILGQGHSGTPNELFGDSLPKDFLTYLVQWGWVGYVTIKDKYIKKLEPKSEKCVMIGYARDHAAGTYRMFNPRTQRVILTRNVQWANWHGLKCSTDDLNITTDDVQAQVDKLMKAPSDRSN